MQILKGLFNVAMLILHTIFWCVPMYFLFGCKIICRTASLQNYINEWLLTIANNWIRTNNLMMKITQNIEWETSSLPQLNLQEWYFIICNHQSWTDILVLQKFFLNKVPFIRFFIKKELMLLPVINLAWLAYDFPILHRHSKETLALHPELREKDSLATQKACEIYKNNPVTILNFLEGTRFTQHKHHKQHSTYQHLLLPKAGGFALAVNAMNQKIHTLLDVTIAYPEGRRTFWDFLCGRIHKIVIHVTLREIPEDLISGNYSKDSNYREKFKNWIHTLWSEKDLELNSMLNNNNDQIN